VDNPRTPPNPPDDHALRGEIVQVGRLLYDRGLVVATDGNISARLAVDRFLATPSGVCKGLLEPEHLIVVDQAGRRVDDPATGDSGLRPTSEILMHLEAYRRRPDIGAVVHAHPPHAVALSIAGIDLGRCVLPEALVFVGVPPVVAYATPSSPEGAAAIGDAVAGHDALVLARHGSLAVGDRPLTALHNTETLEQLARITFLLHLLGRGAASGNPRPGDLSPDETALAPDDAAKLLALRERLGLRRTSDAEEFCAACGLCHPEGGHQVAPGSSKLVLAAPAVTGQAPAAIDAARVRAIVARVVAEIGVE